MLRNRPSRVPLGMADVNQMKQRLKLKQPSHPLVAQTDWAYIHHQQQNTRTPPQPSYNVGEGAQRSRDASLVQLDPNRHVPQFAIYESTDSAEEDSDSDDTASASFESVARVVHIAEVSPTITQVSGYDPPALVNFPPERRQIQDHHRLGTANGHRHHPDNPLASVRSRYSHSTGPGLNTRAGYPHQPSRQTSSYAYQRDPDPRTTTVSRRGQNPNAVSFAPRVHLGSPFQEIDPQHRANIASVYRRGGTLRARPSISGGTTIGRGGMNYQTRPRPMPRPRGSLMPRRPSVRAARRTGGHLRPPAASSIDTVMDRYPIFPSLAGQSNASRPDNLFFPQRESIPQRRGILTPPRELRIPHAPHSRSQLASTTGSQHSVSSRASASSFSNMPMLSALNEASKNDSISARSRDGHSYINVGSVRSSHAGSRTSLLSGSAGNQSTGLPPLQSPLDLLTQELRRLSTGLSIRSQSSLGSTSGATSTDGRLLSGNVFYSDSDDETDERDSRTLTYAGHQNSSHIDGRSINGRDRCQPQRDLGIAARIVDVEADCQSGRIRLFSTSPSTQSLNSLSLMNSSPPGDWPEHPPPIPSQQLARSMRNSHMSGPSLRSQVTPKVRVYDDAQPASMQPQTPADLRHRSRTLADTAMSVSCQTVRTPVSTRVTEQSHLVSPRNAHRNTYPAFQHISPQPHMTNSQPSSPYSPNLDLRNAAAVTAVQRRRIARAVSNENVIDPSTNGMEAGRDALLRRMDPGGTVTIDNTPPREGRYERSTS